MQNGSGKRKRIAVIGSGASAMATVHNITKTKDWRDKYDITIYQMGWRIGGKGASGRSMDPTMGKRIEEHGLHIWFGFYNNAFNMIKEVYEAYDKVGNSSPLQKWDDAFKPQSFVPLFEHIDGKWSTWGLEFPTNSSEPGGYNELLPFWQYMSMAIQWLHEMFSKSEFSRQGRRARQQPVKGVIDAIKRIVELIVDALFEQETEHLLPKALAIIKEHEHHVGVSSHPAHSELKSILGKFLEWLKKELGELLFHNPEARHVFYLIDLGLTMMIGLLEDQIPEKGLDSINNIEFMDWLRKHGAAEETVNSTLVRALYDVGFAYTDGHISKPTYEAGSAIRIIFRLAMTYKGAFMWKMQAGMGDTIFTPIYKVFDSYKPTEEQGGITFKFFHRLDHLELSEDKKSVQRLHFDVQAHTINGRPYDPFVVVNNIPCWPNEPIYDQLVEGNILKGYNLESFWTPWKGQPLTLEKDKDFDIVLLGTPVATLPHHCAQLIDANADWAIMLQKLQTTQTQAYQLWLKPSLQGLGWKDPSPVSTCYVEPVDTWADMSQLLIREDWPEGYQPGNIAYFCGVMPDANVIPPSSVHGFPATQQQRVKNHLADFAANSAAFLWPNAADPNNPNGLNLDLLIDVKNGQGEERLGRQFWRANIDPSERYTLTNVDSSRYRLNTDQTAAFGNLYLVGDWIQNNFNYGCIECCAMSGILAARAITGENIPMSAEKDVFF